MSPSPSMVCPCIILVSLLTCCPPVAGNKVTTYNITTQIGSSVLLPGPDIEINENMYLELKKPGGHPDWLALFHGFPTVHDNYTTRGEYLQNGSFILRNLTKEDSGEYLQEVNTKLLARINLIALAPVKQPELHKQDLHNKQCEVVLNCTGSGEGRLNTTLLHGEKVITTQNGNALVVSVSSRLTESQGSYMCTLANPVSEKTSPFVEIQYPVSIWVLVVLHWSCFVLVHACLSLLFFFILPQLVGRLQQTLKSAIDANYIISELTSFFCYMVSSDIPWILVFIVPLNIFLVIRIYCFIKEFIKKVKKQNHSYGLTAGKEEQNGSQYEEDVCLFCTLTTDSQSTSCLHRLKEFASSWAKTIVYHIIILGGSIGPLSYYLTQDNSPCLRAIFPDKHLIITLILQFLVICLSYLWVKIKTSINCCCTDKSNRAQNQSQPVGTSEDIESQSSVVPPGCTDTGHDTVTNG